MPITEDERAALVADVARLLAGSVSAAVEKCAACGSWPGHGAACALGEAVEEIRQKREAATEPGDPTLPLWDPGPPPRAAHYEQRREGTWGDSWHPAYVVRGQLPPADLRREPTEADRAAYESWSPAFRASFDAAAHEAMAPYVTAPWSGECADDGGLYRGGERLDEETAARYRAAWRMR